MTSLEFPLQLFSSFQKRTLVLFQLLTCKFNLFQKLVFAYLLLLTSEVYIVTHLFIFCMLKYFFGAFDCVFVLLLAFTNVCFYIQ